MAAAEVEDDIYAGYDDYSTVYKDLEQDELFQEVIKSSYGKRSIVSMMISHYISIARQNSIASFVYDI